MAALSPPLSPSLSSLSLSCLVCVVGGKVKLHTLDLLHTKNRSLFPCKCCTFALPKAAAAAKAEKSEGKRKLQTTKAAGKQGEVRAQIGRGWCGRVAGQTQRLCTWQFIHDFTYFVMPSVPRSHSQLPCCFSLYLSFSLFPSLTLSRTPSTLCCPVHSPGCWPLLCISRLCSPVRCLGKNIALEFVQTWQALCTHLHTHIYREKERETNTPDRQCIEKA